MFGKGPRLVTRKDSFLKLTAHFELGGVFTLRRIDLENVLRIKSNNTIRRFGVRHDPIIKVKLYWIIRNLNITGVGSKQRLFCINGNLTIVDTKIFTNFC